MAPRPHWKGYLKLSLVSCPIGLYPAISAAERVSFRKVNTETGNRLRQQMVDSVTGEVVESHNKGRGYQVGEREFLIVQDEELEAAQQEARQRPYTPVAQQAVIATPVPERAPAEPPERPRGRPPLERLKRQEAELEEQVEQEAEPQTPAFRIENTRTIEIERFVPRAQLDPRYFDTPYYIAPRDLVGVEAYAVIRDAMRGKDVVGMGRVVLAKRERPIIIEPLGEGLSGMTLRYSHELRNAAEYFDEIPKLELPAEMLRIAEHILQTKTADFDPAYLEDRYRSVLIEKLRAKHAELPRREVPAVPSRENVISLMEALKKSLAAEKPTLSSTTSLPKPTPRRSAVPAKSAKRSSARARKNA
jgi:Ku protein